MATQGGSAASGTSTTPAPAPRNPAPAPAGGGGGGGGGGDGGGGGGAQGQVQVPANPQFALTPALLSNDVLDFSRTDNIKLYYRAVEPLETEFDVEPSFLKLFLENLRKKAASFNWMPTFTIVKAGETLNLITDYGALTQDDVKNHAATYLGMNTRNAQNSMQIFNCLSSSLTEAGRARVFLENKSYTVNGTTDGPMFLKTILRLAHIDTRATVTVIRTRLSSLDTKMADLHDNVTDFNEYVKLQRSSLEARGEKTLDLLVNLFKGFKAVSDERFVGYIETKEDMYNEGQDISPDELMELAEAKYKTLVENGLWKQQSAAEKKIIAHTAQLKSIQQNKSKSDGKFNKSKSSKDKQGSKKVKDKSTSSKGKGKDPWYYEKPGADDPQTKEVKGKTYHWCKNHGNEGKWVIHKPEDCEAGKKASDSGSDQAKNEKKSLKVKSYSANLNVKGGHESDSEESDF